MQREDGPGGSRRRRGRFLFHARLGVLAAAVCASGSPTRGENVNTSTNTGGDWSNPANWTSGTPPNSGIDTELIFGGIGLYGATFTDDIGSGTFILNELQLASTSTATEWIAGSTSANTLTFASNSVSAGPQIIQSGSGAFAISNNLVLNNTLSIGGAGAGSITFGGNISGSGGLSLAGAGQVVLAGANSYTGITTINSGVLSVSLLSVEGAGAAGAAPSGIGQSNNAAANLVLNGGTLQYTGAATSTDRLFTLGPAGGTLDASGSGAIALTNTGSIAFATPNKPLTLTLAGASTAANTFRPVLADNGTGATSLLKSGAGTWVLTGPNTFTGNLTILAGTLDLNDASGSFQSAENIVFSGSGTFLLENAGSSSNHAQPLNAITFSGGDGTVQVNYTSANHNVVLYPSYFGPRAVGATGNIVVNGGINEQTAGVYTDLIQGFLGVGMFFGGSTYAWIDASGYVGPINYASDPGAFTTAGSTIPSGHQYVQATGNVSNQPGLTLTSLNLAGSNAFGLAPGATLTVNGILKSGNGAGTATISGGSAVEAGAGAELVIRTDQLNDSLAINTPVLANGVNPMTKSGAGTLTFGGQNTYTGITTINTGTLSFAGAGGSSGGGSLLVGGTAGSAVMNLSTTGTVTFNAPDVGGITATPTSPSAAGAINQTSGTFNYSNGATGYLELGTGVLAAGSPGGYGAYMLSGGTLTSNGAASGIRVGAAGLGAFAQSGGSLVLGRELSIGTYGTGVATFTGGTATGSAGYGILVGDVSGTGTLNLGTLAGGNANLISQSAAGVQLAAGGGTLGTLNLNGGSLLLVGGSIHKGSGSLGVINFNGGTLQAGASGLTLIDGTPSAVNVYNGGAVIDTQGFTDTISAPLLAPGGNGIYPAGGTLGVSGGGSGYIGPPLVNVAGGSGAGATAIANLSNGAISGVTLASPGQNYQAGDVLNFSFSGGGPTAAASTFSYTLRASDLAVNNGGGLLKLGSGTLILTATNTYTGTTNILSGTLQVDGSLANTAVNVAAGATLAGAGSIGNVAPSVVSISGAVAPGTPTASATLTTGPMTWNGGGDYVWKVSQAPTGSPASGAGAGWDNLNASTLVINASNSNPFNITIVGNPAGLSPGQAYTWQLAALSPASGGTISGFNPSAFLINVAQFANGTAHPGDFSIWENNQMNAIDVTYSPAPEPSSAAFLLFAIAPALLRRRRRICGTGAPPVPQNMAAPERSGLYRASQ